MTFVTRQALDTYTIRLIQAMECAALQLIKQKELIPAIVLLREFSASPRVQEFLINCCAAYYSTFRNGTPALGLKDGKEWAEALQAGKSALDGFSV